MAAVGVAGLVAAVGNPVQVVFDWDTIFTKDMAASHRTPRTHPTLCCVVLLCARDSWFGLLRFGCSAAVLGRGPSVVVA